MYKFFKRLIDIVISAAAIIILSPVFLLIVIVIRLTSSGKAIFKQERAGKNGSPFTLYKFRTMQRGVDPFGPSPKSDNDSRLNKFGVFLREYSLDELPQFFNVLKGDMSIVGPRPLYVSQISEWDDRQRKRLVVKPGLTGLAQISGRAALTREEKLELDVQYVEKASFWFDMKIIFTTTARVLRRSSIYEKRYSQNQETRE